MYVLVCLFVAVSFKMHSTFVREVGQWAVDSQTVDSRTVGQSDGGAVGQSDEVVVKQVDGGNGENGKGRKAILNRVRRSREWSRSSDGNMVESKRQVCV